MKRLFVVFLFSIYCLLATSVSAAITSPYTIDEKPQVLFGDSITISATSTYYGLENYTQDYVNSYAHITFTYTHHRCCFASYSPSVYIINVDPRATTTITVKQNYPAHLLPSIWSDPSTQTDWYLYDIQFDATGYTVVVKQAGVTEIVNTHWDISGLINSDWVALANLFPISDGITAYSMAFTPVPIYEAPPPPPVATTTPVIIVPGITSSKLVNQNDEKWPNMVLMALSFEDLYLDDLSLNASGESTGSIVASSTIRNIGSHDFFTGLFSKLNTNSLVENTDVFEFPYDWRLDILKTASDTESNSVLSLKEKIDQVKAQRGVTKVNLVAHSMGGLLVKKYLKDYGGGSVDKFIDIATPHMGAPKAFKLLNYGDNFDASFLFGLLGLSSERVKIISQNMPAVYQLLPSRNYFSDSDNSYRYYVFDAVSGDDRLTFDQSSTYLKTAGRNSSLVDRAAAFHDEIDNLNPATYGVETYNIVGCGTPTIGQFYILDNTDGHYIYNIKMINGDGTVPLKSAEAMVATSTYYVRNAQHALLPSTSGVKELVVGLLTATSTTFDIAPYSNLSTTSSGCTIPDGRIVSFHSLIELHIYDSSNNHTGPDVNGDIENNIAGVTYEVIGDNKFAFLPNGVNYTIKGSATASGTFDVRIQELVNGEVATTTLFTDITLTSTTRTQFSINSNTPTQITLDHGNDGVYEAIQNVSNTTSGILESTGKTVAITNLVATNSASSRLIAAFSEPVLIIATSIGEVSEVTIFAITSTVVKVKPTITPVKVVKVNTASEAFEANNEALVYRSFDHKLKVIVRKVRLLFERYSCLP